METKMVGVFTHEELSKLDVPVLEFINNQSTVCLEHLYSISNRLTERSYTILGFIITVYTLLLGIISYFCDKQVIPVLVMLLCFLVSTFFIGKIIRPFPYSLLGMKVEYFKQNMQWDNPDLYKDALLLTIYSNKTKIEFNEQSNKKRMMYYRTSMVVLLLSFVIATISVIAY